jgi:hypothetical protein
LAASTIVKVEVWPRAFGVSIASNRECPRSICDVGMVRLRLR